MRDPIRNWLAGAASVLLWATAADAQNGPFSPEQLASLQQGVRDIYNMEYGRAAERFQAMIRKAPDDRVEPYGDFSGPRRRAMSDRRNLVNGRACIRPRGENH